jgi:hypothetical protein
MSTNRKTLPCERCGQSVTVGAEAEAVRCWRCTGFAGDPKNDGGLSLETPHRRDLADCCNYSAGACIVREGGRCIVLEGGRCGWWEKAVRPGGRESGRVCAACGGDVPKRRRYCDRCRQARRRSAYRESKRRNRVSCPQLTAPTPRNCQESEAARGTFREGRPGGSRARAKCGHGRGRPGVL